MVAPPATPYAAPTPLTAAHDLSGFDSGKPPLDTWLRERAFDNEGRASRTYVVEATEGEQTGRVVAYYTLATGAVTLADLKRRYRHNLPNPVPVLMLGRLAVDRRHAGHGLGGAMLRETMQRTLEVSRSVGARMLVVHAIDDEAVRFYQRYGFHVFPAGGRTMFLPIETIVDALHVSPS